MLILDSLKTKNPVEKFGKDLALWINPRLSSKTFNNNSISQINDLSDNGKNAVQGTATNQPTYTPGGYAGLPYLNFTSANSQRLIASNIKVGGIQTLVFFGSRTNSGKIFGGCSWNVYGWQVYCTDSLIVIQVCKSGANSTVQVSASIPQTEIHLAVVVDNTNLKTKFYLYGKKVGNDQSYSWAYAENSAVSAGIFSQTDASGYVNGKLYNYYLVNRELTPSEIAQDYYEWSKYRIL